MSVPLSVSEQPALVVGLGNPGEQYRATRHNLGFVVLEVLTQRWRIRLAEIECNAITGRRGPVCLAAPLTYMNRSGFAVRCLAEKWRFPMDRILVIYDDFALPLGKLRLRQRGGPGGHRGMESVIRNLGTEDVNRLRLGIGAGNGSAVEEDLVEWVLSPFTDTERDAVDEMVALAADAVESWIEFGCEVTMSQFNR